jgi:hypothetical protein
MKGYIPLQTQERNMKNIKLYAATALIALMALSGTASAHDGNMNDGANHPHMHKHMRGEFKKDKAAFEKMHALHKKLHDVVVADKFDKKAFISLSNQLEQLHSQMAKRHTQMFANKLAGMSQEERVRLAEKFHEHMMMPAHGGMMWERGHAGWSHDARSQNNLTNDWDRQYH